MSQENLFNQPTTDLVCPPGEEGPVTVSISRQARPGREIDYEHWISGVVNAAGQYPGHLGASVLRPSPMTNNEYVLIYRFDSYEHCQQWEQSELRKSWLEKLPELTIGEVNMRRATGLEFWFDLPELPAQKPPSPYKMSIVLTVVVYILIMAINILGKPILKELPGWIQTFIVVAFQVQLLTFFVMPRVTRMLKKWLYEH